MPAGEPQAGWAGRVRRLEASLAVRTRDLEVCPSGGEERIPCRCGGAGDSSSRSDGAVCRSPLSPADDSGVRTGTSQAARDEDELRPTHPHPPSRPPVASLSPRRCDSCSRSDGAVSLAAVARSSRPWRPRRLRGCSGRQLRTAPTGGGRDPVWLLLGGIDGVDDADDLARQEERGRGRQLQGQCEALGAELEAHRQDAQALAGRTEGLQHARALLRGRLAAQAARVPALRDDRDRYVPSGPSAARSRSRSRRRRRRLTTPGRSAPPSHQRAPRGRMMQGPGAAR